MPNETLAQQPRVDFKNRIVWICFVTIFWYIFVCEIPTEFLFDEEGSPLLRLLDGDGYMADASKFVVEYYLSTITSFIGFIVYTGVPKRNRFILRSILPSCPNNHFKHILQGLLIGFIMNFGCILLALIAGDIKLFLNFSIVQIPFYLFALVCVFIQSASEEMWCRGFLYERINVHYPLWAAILVNGVFFGLLHIFNDGAGVLPIADIMVCGISFSLCKWYTGSIWVPMGIHTAWNFTQNFLFGLPNSGLVSEASVFGLDAANAKTTLLYDAVFGVEGAIPAVLADAILGVVCLVLAAKKGRLRELGQKQVTPLRDPQGAQARYEYKAPKSRLSGRE